MTQHDLSGAEYTAADIKVLEFDEHVRRRPAMYFACTQADPELPTAVLAAVIADAIFEPADDSVTVEVRIESDLSFTITDTSATRQLDSVGLPSEGFAGTLIDRRRWPLAAAAALSIRTTIEISCGGYQWSQQLEQLRPLQPLQRNSFSGRPHNLAAFHLDPGYFVPGASLTTAPGALAVHWARGSHPFETSKLAIIDDRR